MPRNRGFPYKVYVDTELMMYLYNTGNYSIATLAKFHGVSNAKLYYTLRDAGCVFNHKFKKELSEETRRKVSERKKGQKLSAEQKRAISERNSCNYNGMNGYGHTKEHNKCYILAYAPKHPHAHKDGYVMLHTIIMERHIGRYLNDDEVVHHVNHDRKDNRLENLQLMKKKAHMSMHMKERNEKRRGLLSIA